MAFKIPFIEATWCLASADSYTILETKKVTETGRGHLASVLIAKHYGEGFVVKEIFCKHGDQEGKKFPKKVKILNNMKTQKHITNIQKAVCNYDGLCSK